MMHNKKKAFYSSILLCTFVGNCTGCQLCHLADSLQQLTKKAESTNSNAVIKSADIVPHFTGMTEDDFKKATNVTIDYDQKTGSYKAAIKAAKQGPFTQDGTGNFILKNAQTGSTYNAGQFETFPHEKLIEETETYTAKKQGTFNVVTSSSYDSLFDSYVDTIALQYQAAKIGEKAVFLVASGQDGVEAVSGNSDPSINIYLGDVTQGPMASFGCFPGALLRLYSQIRESCQVATNSFDPQNPRVHLLKADFLDTQNGYPYLNKNITFAGDITKFLAANNYSFSLMYHKNESAPVKRAIIGNNYFDSFVIPTKQPENTVDQIVNAGLSLGQYKTGFMNGYTAPKAFIEAFAQKILFDIYDSSMRAAIKNNRDTVYLLPIGCGVFGNKKIWAGKALAQCKDLIVKSGLTINYIISGIGRRAFETPADFTGFIEILVKLAKETGGSYLELTLDKNGQVVKKYRVKDSKGNVHA